MKRFNNVVLILILVILFLLWIWFLCKRQEDFDLQADPKLFYIREQLKQLEPDVVPRLRFYRGKKSYTINKQKVYLCLKDQHQNYYNDNMLMYVAIHELAHVLCPEIGHTQKFHDIFQQLLDRAEQIGIYRSDLPIDKDYCNFG